MIEPLTIDKLTAYGFLNEDIENFRQHDKFELMFHKTLNERYWVSNIEGKIYSGEDASRKYYFRTPQQITFPDDELGLIPEYFDLKRSAFLANRKRQAGPVYNENLSKARFKEQEIEKTALEIEQAKNEIAQPKSGVAKLAAQIHRDRMEIYMDWLSTWVEPEVIPPPQPSVLKYFNPIPKMDYFHVHVKDIATMAFYESVLKKINTELTLSTSIYELNELLKITERWNGILDERLKYAPDGLLAKEAFKNELLDTVKYDDDALDTDPVNEGRFWHRFRKIGYEHAVKGEPVTMKHLGYLILKYQCGRPEGVEIIENISNIFDVEGVVNSLAEGAAAAMFIHSDVNKKHAPKSVSKDLFKPNYSPEVYLDLLKTSEIKILNDQGEYIFGRHKKSAITAFLDVLEDKGIINHYPPKELASFINELIPGLDISSRSLQSATAKGYEMKSYFESLITNI